MATGTTVGWISGLESLVRHYDHDKINSTSLEATIIPYGGRGAFSDGRPYYRCDICERQVAMYANDRNRDGTGRRQTAGFINHTVVAD
jgi:hypothetical protein